MSHFTVLVKLKKEEYENVSIEDAISAKLAPYKETYGKGSPYVEFDDCTQEVLDEANKIIDADSYLAERFPALVGKTKLEAYENNLDNLATEYYEYDKYNGLYGTWKNPNGKWDWYQIGGRWRGLLPIKEQHANDSEQFLTQKINYLIKQSGEKDMPLTADVCKFSHLDLTKIFKKAEDSAKVFWEQYNKWLKMKDESDFRKNVHFVHGTIATFNDELFSLQLNSSDLKAFKKCLEKLDYKQILNLIKTKIEPKNKQVSARFGYLFSLNKYFDNLKANNINSENELNSKFNKFKSEGYQEGSFSYEWVNVDHEVRDNLFSLELIKIVKGREIIKDSESNTVVIKDTWPGATSMVTMFGEPEFEYNLNLTLEDLQTKHRWLFEWGTWAVLDNEGWHEKGKMGWWGLSSATEQDDQMWKDGFYEKYLQNEDPETILAVVDCHV